MTEKNYTFLKFPLILKKRLHQTVFAYDSSSTYKLSSDDDLKKIINQAKVDGEIYDFFKVIDGKPTPYIVDIPECHTKFTPTSDHMESRIYQAKRNIALTFRGTQQLQLSQLTFQNKQMKLTIKTNKSLDNVVGVVFVDALNDRYILSDFISIPIFAVKTNNDYSINITDYSSLHSPHAMRKYAVFLKFSGDYLLRVNYDETSNHQQISRGLKKEAIIHLKKEEAEKIKIGIFGSCYSRRAFTSQEFYNPDYKNRYEVVLTQFQSSMCVFSDTSPKSLIDVGALKDLNINAKNWTKTEHEKLFFSQLNETKPDYLIIDLHGDIQRGFVEYPNGERLTHVYYNYPYIEKHPNYKVVRASEHFSTYFSEFKKSVDYFLKEVLAIIPEDKLIINRTNASGSYYNEERELVPFPGKDTEVKMYNMIADLFVDYLISLTPKALVIDSYNYDCYADTLAPGEHSINHYESEFYKKFMKDIDRLIILQNKKRAI